MNSLQINLSHWSILLQVTPPHTDPYHNLLAQVVGRKYVRLYRPDATPGLYPFEEGFTTNCSQVRLCTTSS